MLSGLPILLFLIDSYGIVLVVSLFVLMKNSIYLMLFRVGFTLLKELWSGRERKVDWDLSGRHAHRVDHGLIELRVHYGR